MKYEVSNYGTRIVSTLIKREDGEQVEVTYYLRDDGTSGSEVYFGSNYIVGSRKPSYSRNYQGFKGMPAKYDNTVRRLIEISAKLDWTTIRESITLHSNKEIEL